MLLCMGPDQIKDCKDAGHGVLALAFIDVEIDQLRSRIHFPIALIDEWQDR
jgi:hypothetical protein